MLSLILLSFATLSLTLILWSQKRELTRLDRVQIRQHDRLAEMSPELCDLKHAVPLGLGASLFEIRSDLDKARQTLERHEEAAGGFWTTAAKQVLRIRDMSDGHLASAIACIDESPMRRALNAKARAQMGAEQIRRATDSDWRKKDEKKAESTRQNNRAVIEASLDDLRSLAVMLTGERVLTTKKSRGEARRKLDSARTALVDLLQVKS